MRKKTAIVIMMVLAVNILLGCGKKTVAYGLDGDTEQIDVKKDDIDVEQDLAEMKVVEHWTDEWKFNSPVYADERLTVDTMEIDADVIMPDIEQFPLIEAKEVAFDVLFRKQFVDTFFGDAEIREHEVEQYTKDEIKEIIEGFEEGAQSDDPDVREMYEGFIREYEELLETAPDEGVVDVIVRDPVTVHTVTYADELFPLDEIKEIMKKEAIENTDYYSFVKQGNYSTPKSDEMKLFYMKVDNEQQEGVFCFRPLWCLSDGAQNHPIFVDAVTGEVSYPYKEGEALNGIIHSTNIE